LSTCLSIIDGLCKKMMQKKGRPKERQSKPLSNNRLIALHLHIKDQQMEKYCRKIWRVQKEEIIGPHYTWLVTSVLRWSDHRSSGQLRPRISIITVCIATHVINHPHIWELKSALIGTGKTINLIHAF